MDEFVLVSNEHRLIQDNGKHTVGGVQHELTTHTNVFDTQSPVMLSHDSRSEHRPPRAQ